MPRLQIMVGRTLGGATIAMVQGLLVLAVCVLAGFRPQSAAGLLLAFVYLALIAIVSTRIDPLSYGIDGLRGALFGVSAIGLTADAMVLAAVATIFLGLGAWTFRGFKSDPRADQRLRRLRR